MCLKQPSSAEANPETVEKENRGMGFADDTGANVISGQAGHIMLVSLAL